MAFGFRKKYIYLSPLLRWSWLLVRGAFIPAMTGAFGQPEVVFSHRTHAVKAEAACSLCHSGAEASKTGMDNLLPAREVCGECHAEEETFLYPNYLDGVDNPAAIVRISDYSRKFNHSVHFMKGIDCKVCHGGIELSESTCAGQLPLMEPCMVCHDGKTADRSCIACHEKPEGKYPEDHNLKTWIIDHVFEYSIDLGNSCKICHTNESCQRCHLDREILKP